MISLLQSGFLGFSSPVAVSKCFEILRCFHIIYKMLCTSIFLKLNTGYFPILPRFVLPVRRPGLPLPETAQSEWAALKHAGTGRNI